MSCMDVGDTVRGDHGTWLWSVSIRIIYDSHRSHQGVQHVILQHRLDGASTSDYQRMVIRISTHWRHVEPGFAADCEQFGAQTLHDGHTQFRVTVRSLSGQFIERCAWSKQAGQPNCQVWVVGIDALILIFDALT